MAILSSSSFPLSASSARLHWFGRHAENIRRLKPDLSFLRQYSKSNNASHNTTLPSLQPLIVFRKQSKTLDRRIIDWEHPEKAQEANEYKSVRDIVLLSLLTFIIFLFFNTIYGNGMSFGTLRICSMPLCNSSSSAFLNHFTACS